MHPSLTLTHPPPTLHHSPLVHLPLALILHPSYYHHSHNSPTLLHPLTITPYNSFPLPLNPLSSLFPLVFLLSLPRNIGIEDLHPSSFQHPFSLVSPFFYPPSVPFPSPLLLSPTVTFLHPSFFHIFSFPAIIYLPPFFLSSTSLHLYPLPPFFSPPLLPPSH